MILARPHRADESDRQWVPDKAHETMPDVVRVAYLDGLGWADRHRVTLAAGLVQARALEHEADAALQEMMDCLSPASPHQRVVLRKGAGGTGCGNCWIGYINPAGAGPMAVSPKVERAKRSSQRAPKARFGALPLPGGC